MVLAHAQQHGGPAVVSNLEEKTTTKQVPPGCVQFANVRLHCGRHSSRDPIDPAAWGEQCSRSRAMHAGQRCDQTSCVNSLRGRMAGQTSLLKQCSVEALGLETH